AVRGGRGPHRIHLALIDDVRRPHLPAVLQGRPPVLIGGRRTGDRARRAGDERDQPRTIASPHHTLLSQSPLFCLPRTASGRASIGPGALDDRGYALAFR